NPGCCDESLRQFRGYSARGAASDYLEDDGTLAPTAAGGSVPFAPEVCLPALENMWNTYYDSLVGPYGFKDAFNPSFTACGRLPQGWFDVDYLGIDQGPILLMLENYRSELIWKVMKKNPYIRRGLERAGFAGGWLGKQPAARESTPSGAANPEVPTDPYFYFERHVFRKDSATALPYCFLRPVKRPAKNALPFDFDMGKQTGDSPDKREQYPLVIFLHGSGERGADNRGQLGNGLLAFVEPEQFGQHPCFILAPQCPEGFRWSGQNIETAAVWSDTPTPATQLLIELIEQILKENPAIDPDRVYLTGLSMGGAGAVDLLMRRPEWFAAALPLCGGGDPSQAKRIKHIPIWILHGTRDETVPPERSRRLADALKKLDAPVRYTEFNTLGHAIWMQTYYNPEILNWLFAQRRKP
ncbi:MAG: dienelactone hydrolase family protein, partial [Saprospiraceae bacterium]|nr:dienelactone hydrolase family protein [Saprospiraceae bacterium]